MEATNEQIAVLLDCLRGVQKEVEQPRHLRKFVSGICAGVVFHATKHHPDTPVGNYILRHLFAEWPESSGDIDFPVRHPNCNPIIGYEVSLDKWEGEYGNRRRRLLNWSISRLENEQLARRGFDIQQFGEQQ